jgi:hypothetical protein
MPFLVSIVTWLANARDYLLNAYNTVNGWISPFNRLATPLYGLYNVFYNLTLYFFDFNTWLTWAANRIGQILDISQITTSFQTWIGWATFAYNWIGNAFSNITSHVTTWWNLASNPIRIFINKAIATVNITITNLANAITEVQTWWNSFKSKIPSLNEVLPWFTNWWANVLSKLSLWWNERLLDIKSLFNSWTLELAPFWAGWQEIRNTIFDFLNDPLEWLWSKFTDWFLGAE